MCRFSPDSAFLATSSEERAIDIADVLTGEQAHSVPAGGTVTAMAWHPKALALCYAVRGGKGDAFPVQVKVMRVAN